MNRRDLQTFLLMIGLFGVVFGPTLLLARKDWREILLFGVQRSPDLVGYVWNTFGSTDTPVPLAAADSSSAPFATSVLIPITGRTSSPLVSYTVSPSRPRFLSATADERSRPSQTPTGTPTLIPSKTPTRIPTRTPLATLTRWPTGTPIPVNTPTHPTAVVPTETELPQYP